MVTRKLVKQGAATLMVSIPAKWAQHNNLDKGSVVEVEENNEGLKILAKSGKANKEITISITEENKKDIRNIITHAYRKGFDKIKVKNVSKELAREIQQIVDKMLLGFELTSRSENECIIENVSEPSNKKYSELMKRMLSLIKETHKSIAECLKSNKYESGVEAEAMREHLDKLALFCKRVLPSTEEDVMLNWELLTFLMHIEHKYHYFYEYLESSKFKSDKETIDLFDNLRDYYNLLEESIINKNISSIHKINNLKKEYHLGKGIQKLEKSSGKKAVIISYINDLFRLVQISSSPALSIILNTLK